VRLIAFIGVLGNTARLLKNFDKIDDRNIDHQRYAKIVSEGLGDILWFLADISTLNEVTLTDCATLNLQKTVDLWSTKSPRHSSLHDEKAPVDQRFPRSFAVDFKDQNKRVLLQIREVNIGDQLTDNSHRDDGFRFHDAYHLAFIAVLGWSPVIRGLLKRKRRYDRKIDENEDGARAALLEEAITGLIYDDARRRNFYLSGGTVSIDLLKHISNLTENLEVSENKPWEWRTAIEQGSRVFCHLRNNGGGRVHVDMQNRKLTYRSR
jgi:hypothetical protein